ncbi:hypothetical protein [Ancylobacter terrae]|uniref:hypothetical protein n=1 Tax=Ancylobacter sp. sgz301288 TaxID=3342077 RepID=UPI00385C8D7D
MSAGGSATEGPARSITALNAVLDHRIALWLLAGRFNWDTVSFSFVEGLLIECSPASASVVTYAERRKLKRRLYIFARRGDGDSRSLCVMPRLPFGLTKRLSAGEAPQHSLQFGVNVVPAGAGPVRQIEIHSAPGRREQGRPLHDRRLVFSFENVPTRVAVEVYAAGSGPFAVYDADAIPADEFSRTILSSAATVSNDRPFLN